AYDPFVLGIDPNASDYRIYALTPPADVDGVRASGRRSLLATLDDAERRLDAPGPSSAMRNLYERAFSLLSAGRAREAFNLDLEPARVRDRYGRHTQEQSTLLARRLVEAGVPFVSVFSHTAVEQNSWDTHNNHYNLVSRELAPPADQCFSAL